MQKSQGEAMGIWCYLGGAQSCLVQSSRVPTYVLFLQVTLTTSTPVNHSRQRRVLRSAGKAPGTVVLTLGIKRSDCGEARRNFKGNLVCVAVRNLGESHKCIRLIRILIITELQEPLFTSAADIHLISAWK